MREIKFRGKRVDNGEWVYGDLVRDSDGDMPYVVTRAYWYSCDGMSFDQTLCYEVIEKSVGQYTGLKDKNGKEIYEGDICSTDLSRPYLIVVFRNGAFMYQCHDDGKDYFDIMLPTEVESDVDKYTEVIGNIYDNPSLLEVQP